jgi:hypothetical protein
MRPAALVIALAACSGQPMARVDDGGALPITYSQLYDDWFAVGTPGHCATSGCHSPPIHVWTCGMTKESCYAGMVRVGLVNPNNPSSSLIIDPLNSPLAWFNVSGVMPRDNPTPNAGGAKAISDWITAGALDN